MPRKKAAIHNGGGLIPKALKSKAKALKSKALALYEKMFKRGIPVHPGIPPQQQRNIQNSSPSVVEGISTQPIKYANEWIENPLIDPYNKESLELSIHPESKYVQLYTKIIDELYKYLKDHFPEKEKLTIEDCKYIKNNLPIIHSIIIINDEKYLYKYNKNYYIKYDHLFIKYFVKKRKYKYDSSYREDSEIKLYLDIYNSIKTKGAPRQSSSSQSYAIDEYKLVEELLRDNMELDKTDICIGNLVVKLCKDILKILQMHKSTITEDNYNIALNNKKVLAYVASLYKLGLVKGSIYDDLYKYFETHNTFFHIYNYIGINRQNSNEKILNKFIEIYDIILSLYSNYLNKDVSFDIITTKSGRESSSSSSGSSSGSSSEIKKGTLKLNPYCPKDAVDRISLRTIRKLDDHKRKYVSNILLVKDTKEIVYHCFDTIQIYEYILRCVANSIHPKNQYTATFFTDDDLDEICNKIKNFTKDKATYNSHVDIKEAILQNLGIGNNNINYLSLIYEELFYNNDNNFNINSISGEYKLYLTIEFFSGMDIPVSNSIPENLTRRYSHNLKNKNSLILSLPMFNDTKMNGRIIGTITKIKMAIKRGTYLNVKTFPYRTDNDESKIISLPSLFFSSNPPFNSHTDDELSLYIKSINTEIDRHLK